jgi:hypothetical protein
MKNPAFLFISACLLFLAAPAPVPALEYIQIDAGLVYQVNSEQDSAPAPLMPAAGIVLPWRTFGKWPLEYGLLTFGTYYRLAAGRALPAELENRDFWVQGILASVRLGPEFMLGEKVSLGLQGGISLLLRAPVPLFDDVTGDWGDLTMYFYRKLRFIYPEAGLSATLPLRERVSLRVSARAWFPLFHLWDGEGMPFTDQLLAGLLLGFVVKLP